VPITNNKALRTWKNFVLEFRQEFENKNHCKGSVDSLSLLILALAVKQNQYVQNTHGDDVSAQKIHEAGEPKYRKQTATDLQHAIEASEAFYAATKRSIPAHLTFELTNCAAQHEEEFSSVMSSIDRYDFATDRLALGYTYQFWRDCDRRDAQSNIQSADKTIDKNKLVAFTQIYTPEWVVEFILANSLLPILPPQLARQSRLAEWIVPGGVNSGLGTRNSDTDKANLVLNLSDISLLDPAAGAGNFLVLAFDEMLDLYVKSNVSASEAIDRIFSSQLHGCDIDSLALSVCACALVSRALVSLALASRTLASQTPARQTGLAKKHAAQPFTMPVLAGLVSSQSKTEPLLGSLSESFDAAHPLSKKHDVVVTNPPYIGRKLMSRELKALMKARFPHNYHDLSSAFFERSLRLLHDGGRAGLITQASVMFLPSYQKIREIIVQDNHLITAVDAGPGVFPFQGGEKVNSAIILVEKPSATATTNGASGKRELNEKALFFNLKEYQDKAQELLSQIKRCGAASAYPIALKPSIFSQYHGCAFNYYIPQVVAELIKRSQPLETIAEIRQGLATSDNERFVKFLWQVPDAELGKVWFPYVKGAGGKRFHSPVRHAVNWKDDGAEIKEEVSRRYPYLKGNTAWVVKNEAFYFKKGLCFSFVNTKGIAVRKLPVDCIFDVGASAIFSDECDFLLGYLNSSFMVALASSLNPTINYQVGDLKRLPLIQFDGYTKERLAALANSCAAHKEELSALLDPTSWFGSISNRQLASHKIYSQLETAGFETTEREFIAQVQNLERCINVAEAEIDDLVFESLVRAEGWDSTTQQQVISWIESYKRPARLADASSKDAEEAQLANTFLENLLVKAGLEVSANADSRVPQFSEASRLAIEKRIGSGLGLYLTQTLEPRINKMFLGFPPDKLRYTQ
jgi:hypothetical protein